MIIPQNRFLFCDYTNAALIFDNVQNIVEGVKCRHIHYQTRILSYIL